MSSIDEAYPFCSRKNLLEVNKDGVVYVPFEKMRGDKKWEDWACGSTCYAFGYFPWDVEGYLSGLPNLD